MSPLRTFWLSMHVPYACRHSGACCSSRWPIPIERDRVTTVTSLRNDDAWLVQTPDAPADVAGVIAVSDTGHCVFHRDGCEIQRVFGHHALPSACQHFPRQVLIDRRGVFVTLSHYCPTAARLLFTHEGPVEIVEGPAVLPEGQPEGLDARDVLPPLLVTGVRSGSDRSGDTSERAIMRRARTGRRGRDTSHAVLMDLDGYSMWEAHMVRVLSEFRGPAEAAVNRLETDLMVVQRWRPGERSLSDEIKLRAAQPIGDEPVTDSEPEVVVGRYLAARAFGCWAAYERDGVAGVLRHVRLALRTLRAHAVRGPLEDAIRRTDGELLHATCAPLTPA